MDNLLTQFEAFKNFADDLNHSNPLNQVDTSGFDDAMEQNNIADLHQHQPTTDFFNESGFPILEDPASFLNPDTDAAALNLNDPSILNDAGLPNLNNFGLPDFNHFEQQLQQPILAHQPHSLPNEHSHLDNNDNHLQLHSAYSDGQVKIEVIDDIIYQHKLDGTIEKVGFVTHSSDGLTDYIYDINNHGGNDRLICNVNQKGEIHNQGWSIANDYWGKVDGGKIYDANGNWVGTSDSFVEAAAYLAFIK
ncbi:MAG: hypothetical protein IPL35_14865 [Sphingobacteriales bacterium]|nr:hypothetical protein [Sphingobacteriales bacterium]